MPSDQPCYAFGPFVLDCGRGIVLKQGVRIPLTPRAVDLLCVLVSGAGEILSKDDILRRVWGGAVVEENNLARQISSLRKALDEHAGSREYIATVPGIGYRFVAPVAVVGRTGHDQPELSASPLPPPERPSLSARFMPLIAAAALVVVVVAATLFLLRRPVQETGSVSPRMIRQFTYGDAMQRDPSWSPDGKTLAFASDLAGTLDIWLQKIGDAEPARLTTSSADEWQPAWSPDGRQIVFRSSDAGGGLFVVPIGAGPPRRISTFGDHPQWSPSGDRILFTNGTVRTGGRKLYVTDSFGNHTAEVASDVVRPFLRSSWFAFVDVAWHPDGQRISIAGSVDDSWSMVTTTIDGGDVVTSDIPATAIRMMDEARVRFGRFVWATSGRFVFFEGQTGDTRNIWRVAVDPDTLAWLAPPERLTTDVNDETDIAISPDGTHLAFTARSLRTSVWAFDFDPAQGRLTGGQRPLTQASTGQIELDTVPDGSRVAYRALRAGRNELRELTTSSREDRVLLASTDWSPSVPRWSSDGERLAYTRASSSGQTPGRSVLAVLSPRGLREQLLRLPGDAYFRPSAWTPDGRTILGDCRASPTDLTGICTVPAPAASDVQLQDLSFIIRASDRNLYGPRFSPDGRWVSFVAVDAGGAATSQVAVAPVSGGAWAAITDGSSFDDKVRWSLDGRTVYFVSNRNGYLNLYGRRFDPATGTAAGETFQVTFFASLRRGLPPNIGQVEFAISERRLFLPLAETQSDIWILDHVDR